MSAFLALAALAIITAAVIRHALTTGAATPTGDRARRALADTLTTIHAAMVDPDGPHARTFTAPAPLPAAEVARRITRRRTRRQSIAGRVATVIDQATGAPVPAPRVVAGIAPHRPTDADRDRARRRAAAVGYSNRSR